MDNKPTAVIVGQDITAQKHAEELIQEWKNRYEAAILASGHLLYDWNSETNEVAYGGDLGAILGYSSEEMGGGLKRWIELIHPDDRDFFKHTIEHLTTSKNPAHLKYRVRKKDGEYISVEDSGHFITDDQGNTIQMIGFVKDITRRLHAEEALRKSDERYQLATQGGNVGVWDWNLITGDMFVSRNLKAMLGYEDSEVRNHIDDWGKHVHAGDVEAVMKEANACIKGKKEEYRVEHRMVHKDGSIRWFLASGRVERDETGQAIRFLGTDIDITDLKDLEEKLRQSHKMEALGTLAGGIAHEFNNILGIIIGNTELAMDDVPEWNPAKDSLEEIRTASLRAKDVVRKILSFARKSTAERKPIAISATVKESLKLIRATTPTTIDIREKIVCESEMILADQTDIHQILINLCTNSVHAMRDKSGVLEIRLESVHLDQGTVAGYEGLKPGDHVRLMIQDSGKGIEPGFMERILDPYFTTKAVDEGLGMGLAIVYGIVKKNDGAIRIESKLGKGTKVEVLFPLIEAQDEVEVPIAAETLPKGSERILLVDDEASLMEMVKQLLERLGYQVVGKTDSMEALKMFQSEPNQFDLVITDMAMPQMAGDQLAMELIKIRSDLPIILCTGHSDRIDEEKARRLGIRGYYMKPFDKKTLAKEVRKVLDEAKSDNQQ